MTKEAIKKEKDKSNEQPMQYIEQEINHELPCLFISRTKHLSDFETERMELRSVGRTSKEALEGMKFLLSETKRVE